MSQKGIREGDGKRLIQAVWNKYFDQLRYEPHSLAFANASELADLAKLPEHAWLNEQKIVLKPDMLFGKRGQNKLVFIGNLADGLKWIEQKTATVTTLLSGAKGTLNYFLAEQFVPHGQGEELYLSFATSGEGDLINFSFAGGVEVESNWSSVQTLLIPTLQPRESYIGNLDSWLDKQGASPQIKRFVTGSYAFFRDYEFAFLEFNPFLIQQDQVFLLDLVAKLDTCAVDVAPDKYKLIQFTKPFGFPSQSKQEKLVEELDSQSGSSLKLTILHPQAPVWMLLAGGGGSVDYLDTAVRTFGESAVANYGEYSGNPSTQETYQYSLAILDCLLHSDYAGKQIILIGGSIANFTDVSATFKGIRRAFEELQEELGLRQIKVLVRRGGPNEALGLQEIKQTLDQIGLDNEVFGAEMPMSHIVKLGTQYLYD